MNTLIPLRRGALLLLALAAGGCDQILSEPERDPEDVTEAEVLAFSRTGGNQPLRADGASRDTLVARIPPRADTRVVTFRTSRGRFLLSPGAPELEVRARESGDPSDERLVARAVLVADTLPGEALVSASIGEFTQYLFVPFVH